MSATVKWLGHASAVVGFGDEQILIDPLGRRRSLSAGEVHTVLITHSHIDHLNRWTLKAIDRGVTLVVPKGARPVVADLGFSKVIEAEPGDHIPCGSIDVLAVDTKHDKGRWRKGDHPICVGYILQKDGVLIHHAGDVDMSDFSVFDDIGKLYDIDATLLPIGGMLPPWWYRMRRHRLDKGVHIDSDTALGIAQRLDARHMIPIHWGTVNLRIFHSAAAPKNRLVRIADEQDVRDLVSVLGHGQSLDLTKRRDT